MEVLEQKRQKGSVCVEEFKNRIRLRWTHERERYCLYPGLPNNEISYKAALKLASRIELDIACDNFDTTLARYKSSEQSKKEKKVKEIEIKPSLSVVNLFDQFTDHKSKYLYRRSLEKYYSLTTYLKKYFQNTLASAIAPKDAEAFIEWLKPKLEPITLKERVVLLRACWNWAIKENILTNNPWEDLPSRIKIPPRQQPKPFSKEELQKILNAFETHEYYNHYLTYVKFRMLTGVRVSEASGLRWSDVHEDFSSIWIGSSLARGDRKSTKTNKARTIPCNDLLKDLLKSIKPKDAKPDDLVFLSRQGSYIKDNNFNKRAWKTCLAIAGVHYRPFTILRHSFVSHCLQAGMSPLLVSSITGHTLEVLYDHYAGCVSGIHIPENLYL